MVLAASTQSKCCFQRKTWKCSITTWRLPEEIQSHNINLTLFRVTVISADFSDALSPMSSQNLQPKTLVALTCCSLYFQRYLWVVTACFFALKSRQPSVWYGLLTRVKPSVWPPSCHDPQNISELLSASRVPSGGGFVCTLHRRDVTTWTQNTATARFWTHCGDAASLFTKL